MNKIKKLNNFICFYFLFLGISIHSEPNGKECTYVNGKFICFRDKKPLSSLILFIKIIL